MTKWTKEKIIEAVVSLSRDGVFPPASKIDRKTYYNIVDSVKRHFGLNMTEFLDGIGLVSPKRRYLNYIYMTKLAIRESKNGVAPTMRQFSKKTGIAQYNMQRLAGFSNYGDFMRYIDLKSMERADRYILRYVRVNGPCTVDPYYREVARELVKSKRLQSIKPPVGRGTAGENPNIYYFPNQEVDLWKAIEPYLRINDDRDLASLARKIPNGISGVAKKRIEVHARAETYYRIFSHLVGSYMDNSLICEKTGLHSRTVQSYTALLREAGYANKGGGGISPSLTKEGMAYAKRLLKGGLEERISQSC